MTDTLQPENTCGPTDTPGDIDIDALRDKYRVEREKRLREEGSKQYVETAGAFAGFAEEDPHTPFVERDVIDTDIDVAVLGGGFAGLLCGAHLKKAGVEDVHIIEQGGDFGGVWYWNRYPGIQCDNESYCYVPFLEELDFMPSKKFADGAEIYQHCRNIGKHFGLYDGAIFSTQVRDLKWDDDINRWRISTNRGDDIRARFVVLASGSFNRPKLPGVPGIQDFGGHIFHSSRWDYDYTGGDATGGLEKLADKKVALIGTGATGVQLVPFLGRDAEHLYVFQRTPSTVDERNNTPTDPEWVKTLTPGWQKERQRNFHSWTFEGMALGQPDLVCDFWTELGRNTAARVLALPDPASMTPEQFMGIREEEDYKLMERLRRRIESLVDDPDTAEALKPFYRFLCKRPCSNDDYLSTFNRPNVTLVDVSESKGVERITEKGIVIGGKEYEVDCIIFASGFEITTEISRRFAIDTINGRDGVSLYEHWADGYKTLHGLTSVGFPNQFYTGFTQVGISANISANYDLQGEHIAYIIVEALNRGASTVEPAAEAQAQWCQTIKDNLIDNSAFDAECTPGYYNNEGGGGGEGIRSHLGEPYGPGFYAFGDLLKLWRDNGDLAGLIWEQMTPAELRFDGRVAVVTGAGRGLGREYALLLASRGAAVVVNDVGGGLAGLDEAEGPVSGPAAEVVDEITAAGGRAVASTDSVATAAGGQAIIDTALESFGRIDALIHNAGNVRRAPLAQMSYEDFDAVLDVHLRGAFHVVRPAFSVMTEAGYGRIVLTSSIGGLYGNHDVANYGAAKAGILGLSNIAALEGATSDVKCNVIVPAAVTRMAEGLDTSAYPPMGADLVAPTVGWLTHETCSVTGEILVAIAGRVARAYIAETPGVYRPSWTIEQVAEDITAIRDTADAVLFPVVPDGHADHIRYSFAMAAQAARAVGNG